MNSTDMGVMLKVARDAAGLSLQQLAERVHFSKPHLSNVECGRKPVTLRLARAYDEALGTGGTFVTLLMEENDMKRRTALGALGLVAGAGPEAFHEALRVGLMETIGIDDWMATAEEHGRRFMTAPPSVFRTQLAADLIALRQSIVRAEAPTKHAAAARLLMLQGMAAANIGDVHGAATWYRSARMVADTTRDEGLRQWVRGREAFRRGYEGAPTDEVLMTARDVEDVEAHLARAQALARLGEPGRAVEALEAARRAHERGDQSDGGTIYAMPAWRMALSAAYVYALLGDVAACERELADTLPPASVKRWEAQHAIQRAVALARAGDAPGGRMAAKAVMRDFPDEQKSIVVVNMYREACRA